MIICKRCGNHNADGESFCAACGAFLEWTGEKVAEQPHPAPVPPPPPPEPERPGLVQRVREAVRHDDAAAAPPGSAGGAAPPPAGATSPPPPAAAAPPGPVAAPSSAPAAGPGPAYPASSPPPVAPDPPAGAALASPLPAAPAASAEGVPPARPPEAVKPQPSRPRPSPKVDPSTGRPFNAGDLICGQCGAGNDPSRNFCRRCGSSLAEAVTVGTPWYRRLFPARQPRVVAAGERPGSVRGEVGFRPPLLAVLGVIAVVLAASYLLIPSLRHQVDQTVGGGYHAVKVAVAPTNVPVVPQSASASSEVQGHPASMVIDGFSNTYWEVDLNRDPNPVLTLSLSSSTDLDYAVFTNGLEDNFASQPRPRDLHIVYSNGSSQDVTLQDQHKPYTVALNAHGVRSVEIHVNRVYPAQQSKIMALAEVELFRRD